MAMVRFLDPALSEFRKRMDADYWDPQYTDLITALTAQPGVKRLGEYLPSGRIVTAYKGTIKYQPEGIPLLTARHILATGIDWEIETKCVAPDGPADPSRSRLRDGDIILVRSGVGCAGECAIVRLNDRSVNVRSELYILRPTGIDPYVLYALLKTCSVRLQMKRLLCGVGTINLSQQEIRSILVIEPSRKLQVEIREHLEKSVECHEEAMALKPRKKVAAMWANRYSELRYHEKLRQAEEHQAAAIALLEGHME